MSSSKNDSGKNSIYAPENKYGYRLNINHPWVNKQYEAYKKAIGEPMILSDSQRFDFEKRVLDFLEKRKRDMER